VPHAEPRDVRPPRSWKRVIERLASHEEKLRFLFVGGWNVLFAMGALWVMERLIPYGPGSALALGIGVLGAKQVVLAAAWVLGVTQNLFTFKLLVFRTKGDWLREYLRMYVTYSGTFVVESVMVQVISATLGWSLFWAKVPTLTVVTVLSYIGHKYFTFRTVEEAVADDLAAPFDHGRAESDTIQAPGASVRRDAKNTHRSRL
jgi:putative flippase GtrA